jgi:hypothetical protein
LIEYRFAEGRSPPSDGKRGRKARWVEGRVSRLPDLAARLAPEGAPLQAEVSEEPLREAHVWDLVARLSHHCVHRSIRCIFDIRIFVSKLLKSPRLKA